MESLSGTKFQTYSFSLSFLHLEVCRKRNQSSVGFDAWLKNTQNQVEKKKKKKDQKRRKHILFDFS